MEESPAEPSVHQTNVTTRQLNWAILAIAIVVTIIFGFLQRKLFDPRWLLITGVLGLIVINIVLFLANLAKAMGAMKKVKSEGELEQIMAPALQGSVAQLGTDVLEIFRWFTFASIGVTVGAAFLLVLKHYAVRFWY